MTERDLHKQISNLLDKLGIVYIHSRTDKKTTNAAGTPDFIFCVSFCCRPMAVAWEVKLPKSKLSPEQVKFRSRMETPPNNWDYIIIHSLDDAIKDLKSLEILR